VFQAYSELYELSDMIVPLNLRQHPYQLDAELSKFPFYKFDVSNNDSRMQFMKQIYRHLTNISPVHAANECIREQQSIGSLYGGSHHMLQN